MCIDTKLLSDVSRYGDNHIDIVVSLISATKNIYTVRANLWLCTSTCSTSDCCSFKQPVMCIHAYIHVIPLYRCTCLQYFHITYIYVTDFILQQPIHRSVTALLQVCNRSDLSQTFWVWALV